MSSFTPVFEQMLELFGSCKATYYITRNYEGYPEKFTGDIDIYIDLKAFRARQSELDDLFVKHGWRIFKKLDRPWLLAYQVINDREDADRRVMVVELFDSFQWRCFEYLEIEKLQTYGIQHNGISILREDICYFLAFLHYAFWCGFVPSKYQDSIRKFVDHPDRDQIVRELVPACPEALCLLLEKYCAVGDGEWVRLDDIPEPVFVFPNGGWGRLKKLLLKDVFHEAPVATVFRLMLMGWLRVLDVLILPGRIFVLEKGSPEDAQKCLYTLKKYHLFKNHAGRTVGSRFGIAAMGGALKSLIQGGACIVPGEQRSVLRTLFLGLFRPRTTKVEMTDRESYSKIEEMVKYL